MKMELHKAETRGHANHGWLDTHHTFSFADYYAPSRMGFGALRVLNDDIIEAGRGFGTHPHDNMEIISIPLSGALEHTDSMGNKQIIRQGEIQVMSAGTGIFHSEYNHENDRACHILQIWVRPNRIGVEPRYDQISLADVAKENELYQVLSPHSNDQGVWIYQDAWFYLGSYNRETSGSYRLNRSGNGVYLFVIEGAVELDGSELHRRDGAAVSDTDEVRFTAKRGTELLLMEVPLGR